MWSLGIQCISSRKKWYSACWVGLEWWACRRTAWGRIRGGMWYWATMGLLILIWFDYIISTKIIQEESHPVLLHLHLGIHLIYPQFELRLPAYFLIDFAIATGGGGGGLVNHVLFLLFLEVFRCDTNGYVLALWLGSDYLQLFFSLCLLGGTFLQSVAKLLYLCNLAA